MRRAPIVATLMCLLLPEIAISQSVVERSPNIQGVWGLQGGDLAFVLAHRFEVLEGGDQLFSVPTLTLGVGLPLALTGGVDFTSFSEVVPDRVTGNEAQFWLKRPYRISDRLELAGIVAYNTAAASVDGAVDLRLPMSRFDVYGEARVHSDLFGEGELGTSGTFGAAFHLNRYVALTGDFGGVLSGGSYPAAWSAALALAIPATPHSLSLQLSNSGATTLQGVAREKSVGERDVRYGFTFTVPLGNRTRWERLIRPEPPPPPTASADDTEGEETRADG